MITFRTPCCCEVCDPDQQRRSLPTFGRSPSEPRALPTFGRSASASSLTRAASTRSLSPRRPREEVEVKPCDWSSLFTLAGELGTKQSQVLRKLRDEQEEKLLLQCSSQNTVASPSVKPRDGEEKEDKEEKEERGREKGKAEPRAPGLRREGSAPALKRSEAKKVARPKSAAVRRDRHCPDMPAPLTPTRSTQAPKAKAKAKTKAKIKPMLPKEVKEDAKLAVPNLELSHGIMWSSEGEEIPLQRRDEVAELLQELHNSVANPLCKHFRIRYDYLLEQHCQERKAGVARRAPKVLFNEERYLTTVRLRVRKHPAKGDPQKEMIGRGTMMAVLLHELAHLRYMNHGQEFMLFLREIFAEAHRRGLFNPDLVNELPSCRPWENLIYQTGGGIDDQSLMAVFVPDSSTCATPRSSTPIRGRPTAPEKLEKDKVGAMLNVPTHEPRASDASTTPSGLSGDRESVDTETTTKTTETTNDRFFMKREDRDQEGGLLEAERENGSPKVRQNRVLRPKKA
ncbi:unnamed protein product [Durusdinium trenchii]|uniref:WLM domain-containing protein n=1 Tax=Durusdinium trenchii TaxID=1381693 RepID=A0ABP0P1E9_9DINO